MQEEKVTLNDTEEIKLDELQELPDEEPVVEEEDSFEVPKISAATITRTVLMILSTINLILTSTGHDVLPFKEEEVSLAISVIFQIVMTVITWWKDNDITVKTRVKKAKINALSN